MTLMKNLCFPILLFLISCGTMPLPEDQPDPIIPDVYFSAAPENPSSPDFSGSSEALSLTMILTASIDLNHAPLAENDAERFAFKQIFETLTRVDSEGKLQPALASDWQQSKGGKQWVFTIRQGAVFSDGTPITSKAVVLSWLRAARMDFDHPAPSPFQWFNVLEPGVRILDSHRVQISLPEAMDDLPLLLAHQALAVVYSSKDGIGPLGSGPSRIDPSLTPPAQGLRLLPNPHHPRMPRWQHVDLVIQPEFDTRSLLENRADFAVLRNQTLVNMVSASARHQVIALPWDRMYLLVCPPGPTELRQRWNTGWSSRELVNDVSVDQTSTLDQLTFAEPRSRICPLQMLPQKAMDWPQFSWKERIVSNDDDLVLFPDNDPEAEALAEYLAQHAGRPLRPADDLPGRTPMTTPRRPAGGMAPQAMGISPDDFAGALQSGKAGAYILPLNRTWFSSCRQMAGLIGLAGWLQDAAMDPGTTSSVLPEGARAANPRMDFDVPGARVVENRLRRGRTVLPLTISRSYVVAGKSLRGFTFDYDGILNITDVSR